MWMAAGCAALACALAAGCVTWVGDELPPVRYEDLTPADPKPAADYEILLDNGRGSVAKLPPDAHGVREVLERSRCFSRIRPGAGGEPFHLELVFSNPSDPASRTWRSVNSALFLITLTLFPAIASETTAVVIDVQSGNRSLKRYEYRESDGGVCWTPIGLLGLGVYALFTLGDPSPCIEKILLNFLHDVEQDGLMREPAAGCSPSRSAATNDLAPHDPTALAQLVVDDPSARQQPGGGELLGVPSRQPGRPGLLSWPHAWSPSQARLLIPSLA